MSKPRLIKWRDAISYNGWYNKEDAIKWGEANAKREFTNTYGIVLKETKDYILVSNPDRVGYGVNYGSCNSSIPEEYYFSGTVEDSENPDKIVDSVVLDDTNKSSKVSLSIDNLTATLPILYYYTHEAVFTTVGKNTGKWYWEIRINDSYGKSRCGVGIENIDCNSYALGDDKYSWGYEPKNGKFYNDNECKKSGASSGNGDIIGIALDSYFGRIWWSKNGEWMLSGNPVTGQNPIFEDLPFTLFPMGSLYSSTHYASNITFIFSESELQYSIPNGFEFYGGNVIWTLKGINI